MRAFVRTVAGAALLCTGASTFAIPQVFLVQNSGWMEPFYSDARSQFKPLVTELVVAAAQPGDPVVLAAFNQALPGAPSPRGLLSVKAEPALRQQVSGALDRLEVARKPGSSALADTDLGEALGAAINTALAGKPGIIWLVTNNRNSPNNDQATATRNREFYELIHQGGSIDKALAFPLRMPVQGAHYHANGLMVYAFGVGQQGARALDQMLAAGRVGQVITEPPARLKPLDRDTVRLVPRRVDDSPGVSFSMAQGGLLRADVDPQARAPAARIGWYLENTIYPYTIAGASISARSLLAGESLPITLGSGEVRSLAPGVPEPLASTMRLPVAHIPARWSIAALKSAGSAYVLPGRIELHLAGQKLELSRAFRERMEQLFPGDPLPEIFVPPDRIKESHAMLPIEVRMHYPLQPLLLIGGASLLALLAAAVAAYAFARPRKVRVTVGDEVRMLHARPGTTQPIFDNAGNQVAQLKTTLFGHHLTDLREGAQVHLGGR
ncbi:hypothetical protein E4O92_21080 [Massilia horti]|uniref:VWA domain-containing protein n=1 Tax=Massilia horti TaxID=2562153 RepID=A0A4Y9SPN8_9BURK|nr:hypothetical protein E4O92_21080 [Massilia horti]